MAEMTFKIISEETTWTSSHITIKSAELEITARWSGDFSRNSLTINGETLAVDSLEFDIISQILNADRNGAVLRVDTKNMCAYSHRLAGGRFSTAQVMRFWVCILKGYAVPSMLFDRACS